MARCLVGQLAGFGPALEVLTPPEIRDDLGRIGRQLAALYGDGPD
jgi:predicted DNA-binding transcriptional regulator YafY